MVGKSRKGGRRARPVRVSGRLYRGGVPELAAIFGVSAHLIRVRRQNGWSWEEAVGLKERKVHRSDATLLTIDGHTYDAAEAARKFNVEGRNPGHKVRNRLRLGWTERQAVGLDPPPKRRIKKKRQQLGGKSYPIPRGTGTVYLVTNNVNGKQYVGITSSTLKQRKAQYRAAVKGSIENRPIVRAMRRHGFDKFKFKTIDQTAETFPDLLSLEEKYIARYNTYKAGYNATAGGEAGGREITIHGTTYPSVSIAALAHDIEPHQLIGRLRAGMSPEEAVAFEYRTTYELDDPQRGRLAGTLTELCEIYDVPFNRAYQRLASGWTVEEVVGLVDHSHATVNSPVTVDGRKFKSLRDACDHFGVAYKLAWRRRKKRGWTLEQALGVTEPPTSVRHTGQRVQVGKRTFRTKTAAMRALGISYEKLQKRIAAGRYQLID